MKKLLSGNEAVARGAYEAGVRVATAYPGTPSTEILETIAATYPEIYTEWSTNEKVALEVAIGASLAGARALVAMKHVGLNVAADPLVTLAYTGVNGGLVVISADDPGMHSSQNEQDNRYYAKFAKLPMLEPADSQEAKDLVVVAFEISEKFDTPVLVRLTTRISHSTCLVELGECERETAESGESQQKDHFTDNLASNVKGDPPGYSRNTRKYVMIPAHARERHVALENRLLALAEYSEIFPGNVVEWVTVNGDRYDGGKDNRKNEKNDGGNHIGIITSGISYQYAREALGDAASYLKLSMTHPLPQKLIRRFAAQVGQLYVIEELEPYIEEQVKAMGIAVTGKELFPNIGELGAEIIASKVPIPTRSITRGSIQPPFKVPVPVRPPVMCPGCPHRGVFYVLKRLKVVVTGDIGCYTLGVLPPLESMDTCICMGASVGSALGFSKVRDDVPVVAVIGDSTFIHSGITGLVDVVYNKGKTVTAILDNGTTAMTGHQDHPGTGITAGGEPTSKLDLEALVRAIGVEHVVSVDPYDLATLRDTFETAIRVAGPSVVIARRPCILLLRGREVRWHSIDQEKCSVCKVCLGLGCPAMQVANGSVEIDPAMCTGCGLCAQVCKFGAIVDGPAGGG